MLLQCEWRLAFSTDYAPPTKNSLFKNKNKTYIYKSNVFNI